MVAQHRATVGNTKLQWVTVGNSGWHNTGGELKFKFDWRASYQYQLPVTSYQYQKLCCGVIPRPCAADSTESACGEGDGAYGGVKAQTRYLRIIQSP